MDWRRVGFACFVPVKGVLKIFSVGDVDAAAGWWRCEERLYLPVWLFDVCCAENLGCGYEVAGSFFV